MQIAPHAPVELFGLSFNLMTLYMSWAVGAGSWAAGAGSFGGVATAAIGAGSAGAALKFLAVPVATVLGHAGYVWVKFLAN